MKKMLWMCLLTTILGGNAHASDFRFNPIPIEDYKVSDQDNGRGRLKISIALNDEQEVNGLKIGGIVVCSTSACFRPNIISSKNSASALNGTASLVVDSSVPPVQISSIHFEELHGSSVKGSIELVNPLNIERGYYGGELLVMLSRAKDQGGRTFTPTHAASNLLREDGNSIYYNPKFAAKISLDPNVYISIPENALKRAAIINIQISDTGEHFPLIDLYPYESLNRPVAVTVKKIEDGNNAKLAKSRVNTNKTSKKIPSTVTKTILKFGVLDSSFFEGNNSKEPLVQANSYDNPCYQILNQQGATTDIRNAALSNNGVAYYTTCTDIPPYIHIIYVDLRYNNVPLYIPYYWSTGARKLNLRPLTELAPQDATYAINGFHWEGDLGTNINQYGYPNGYVRSNGWVMGTNRVGGGNATTGTSAGNKRIMSWNSNYAYGPITFSDSSAVNYSVPGAVNTISSSTSVLREGICSTDTLQSRWSFIGAGYDGSLIMASSTSNGTTNAAEVCEVLRLLQGGNGNILRMDGGPSAAMTVNGVHVNPLVGAESFKYGTARRIPWGIQVQKSN